MPLKVIRAMIDEDPEHTRALTELEDRVIANAVAGEAERVTVDELVTRYEVPRAVIERLVELGVLTPSDGGYSPSDARVVEAISRFRAGGYDERIGFTVYDTLRYKRVLEQLVKEEVQILMQRLAGEMAPDDAVGMISRGVDPLKDLIAALHSKLLLAELRQERARRG